MDLKLNDVNRRIVDNSKDVAMARWHPEAGIGRAALICIGGCRIYRRCWYLGTERRDHVRANLGFAEAD